MNGSDFVMQHFNGTTTSTVATFSRTAAAFPSTIASNGTAVCLTNDARLSDQRVPVDGSVSDAKLADAKLSLASGGLVTGVARFQGTVVSTPAGGVTIGGGSTSDAAIKIIGANTSANSYIDFGHTTVANRGRILVANSGATMSITASGGITLASATTCSNALTCNGGLTIPSGQTLTCNGQLVVPAGQTMSLGGVAYAMPPSTTFGPPWPALCAIKSDGVMEIGKYLDFHDATTDTTYDYRIRLTCASTTLSCSGTFASTGLSSSSGLTVTTGSSSVQALSATTGTFSSSLAADSGSITNALSVGGVVTRLQHHTQAYILTGPVSLAASASTVLLPLTATQNVRGTSFNTTTKRWTAPVAGMYQINVIWYCMTTTVLNTELKKNGTLEAAAPRGALTHVLYLTTSDYLEVYVRHNDTVSCAFYPESYYTSVTLTSL
jgi:hypothetical protein